MCNKYMTSQTVHSLRVCKTWRKVVCSQSSVWNSNKNGWSGPCTPRRAFSFHIRISWRRTSRYHRKSRKNRLLGTRDESRSVDGQLGQSVRWFRNFDLCSGIPRECYLDWWLCPQSWRDWGYPFIWYTLDWNVLFSHYRRRSFGTIGLQIFGIRPII